MLFNSGGTFDASQKSTSDIIQRILLALSKAFLPSHYYFLTQRQQQLVFNSVTRTSSFWRRTSLISVA